MSQKQQMIGRHYAQLRKEKKQAKEFNRLIYELYQEMDTHTHSDPTGRKAISKLKINYPVETKPVTAENDKHTKVSEPVPAKQTLESTKVPEQKPAEPEVIIKPDPQNAEKKSKYRKRKPASEASQNNGDIDFSFLVKEPEETEEDKRFDEALREVFEHAELMEQFRAAIRVRVVADFIIKAIKQKLTEYPDTTENANNPDRQAFVNAFNIFKQIIRKG